MLVNVLMVDDGGRSGKRRAVYRKQGPNIEAFFS
jgi:hypothetical protein